MPTPLPRHAFFALATVALALSLFLPACSSNKGDPSTHATTDDNLLRFRDDLVGSFSSQKQSVSDKSYFDIRLRIAPIWTDRTDGPWLYVEQATAAALDKPYRQRVYRLARISGDAYKSDVYLLPEPALSFAGAWRNPSLLARLTPDRLDIKSGCAVVMKFDRVRNLFEGGTEGNGCESNLRGAAYATSQVTLLPDALISWDRGYDKSGKQVWGAEKGGYRFDKLSSDPTAE